MALVAYGSSDDSDTSDNEDNAPVLSTNVNKHNSVSQTNKETYPTPSCVAIQKESSAKPTPTDRLLDVEPENIEDEFTGHISDEDDNFTPISFTPGLNLPAPKNEPVTYAKTSGDDLGLNSSSNLLVGKHTIFCYVHFFVVVFNMIM